MLDWRSLPVKLAATLAAGLPDGSRCRQSLGGPPQAEQMQAATADALHRIEWRLCGCPGGKPPESILAEMLGTRFEGSSDLQGFDSAEEFEAARRAARGGE